jgi:hypothetical protein
MPTTAPSPTNGHFVFWLLMFAVVMSILLPAIVMIQGPHRLG